MIAISPEWLPSVRLRILYDLEELGASVEINEDGLMRATWPARVEEIQSAVIVKLQVLPVVPFGKGWAGSGVLTAEHGRLVMTKQLRKEA